MVIKARFRAKPQYSISVLPGKEKCRLKPWSVSLLEKISLPEVLQLPQVILLVLKLILAVHHKERVENVTITAAHSNHSSLGWAVGSGPVNLQNAAIITAVKNDCLISFGVWIRNLCQVGDVGKNSHLANVVHGSAIHMFRTN